MTDKTHFGYEYVDKKEKAAKVSAVFDSVASNYDVMNDVMSLGVHRFWKHFSVMLADVRQDMVVLDLASGTCDLAIQMGKKLAGTGRLVASDINPNMLAKGRDRMVDKGLIENIEFVEANAEQLPFADNTFDLVTMAFGLRNVTDKDQALREIFRVLKPGGKCLVLEFSKPSHAPLETLYDFYSFNVLPKLGKWIAKDEASYRYLAESIRMHPDQATLQAMFDQAGFSMTKYQNLTGGIVAIHQGIKI
ncbi:bifunctional demethylmenaquinone methyltransferase/2-methoxy-6-polyprenyl-1,4-benzoquinol methylase UbiE [Ostreibacterium oceani]|uniref:Ubiquinone/menaquinone biosynthesis C-methyltransferase UbiE n=1 Tax=Ostreibacterium oceani TaxID=2654998 RepID=A0A6N7EUK4_9GAMM|nr:bifunctional demethylmenaquinone methyltransferase/2-methoxy-6-polyprenyl-1,4-benzoquinol methylase UbiE [Ostreibacterium oceani]MPV86241.1 bifunctional demethylmenaquinone methyltransferase/2-methoxy-6-polyprenyl-1,4-benzoquinol methylase UbiE [Ostreibacterium oceani]